MAKSSPYTHWMQRVDITSPTQPIYDIESHFSGLLYMRTDGMNDIGKSKNVYTEEYVDSDRLRVYLPSDDNYTNEATKVTMHFLVVGDAAHRQSIIHGSTEKLHI